MHSMRLTSKIIVAHPAKSSHRANLEDMRIRPGKSPSEPDLRVGSRNSTKARFQGHTARALPSADLRACYAPGNDMQAQPEGRIEAHLAVLSCVTLDGTDHA